MRRSTTDWPHDPGARLQCADLAGPAEAAEIADGVDQRDGASGDGATQPRCCLRPERLQAGLDADRSLAQRNESPQRRRNQLAAGQQGQRAQQRRQHDVPTAFTGGNRAPPQQHRRHAGQTMLARARRTLQPAFSALAETPDSVPGSASFDHVEIPECRSTHGADADVQRALIEQEPG
jgi:hypothetical protein